MFPGPLPVHPYDDSSCSEESDSNTEPQAVTPPHTEPQAAVNVPDPPAAAPPRSVNVPDAISEVPTR
eukprot:6183910-Pleurochrysis_carterae.AAC.1